MVFGYTRQEILSLLDTSYLVLPQENVINNASLSYDPHQSLNPFSGEMKLDQGMPNLKPIVNEHTPYLNTEVAAETDNYQYLWDSYEHQFVYRLKQGVSLGYMVSPNQTFEQDSLSVLESIVGIPSVEFGLLNQIDLMSNQIEFIDGSAAIVGTPKIEAIKVFVDRSINNIPVMGHNAVFTYTPNRTLSKIYGQWPALSVNGHNLTTTDSFHDIRQSVADTLLGVNTADSGSVSNLPVNIETISLHSAYEPVIVNERGDVALDLVIQAYVFVSQQQDPQSNQANSLNEKNRLFLIYPSNTSPAFDTPILNLISIPLLALSLIIVGFTTRKK